MEGGESGPPEAALVDGAAEECVPAAADAGGEGMELDDRADADGADATTLEAAALRMRNEELEATVQMLRVLVDRLTKEKLYLLHRLLRYDRDGDLALAEDDDDDADAAPLASSTLSPSAADASPLPASSGVAAGSPPPPPPTTMMTTTTAMATSMMTPPPTPLGEDPRALPPIKRPHAGSPGAETLSAASPMAAAAADAFCMAKRDSGRCRVLRMPDSLYCWRHAHLDPRSEYVLCASADARGRQCGNSIKKSAAATNPYCNLHTRNKIG